jgi:hypothetical protein
MSTGVADVSDKKEQLLAELEQLLIQQIAAAHADDFATVEKLAEECTNRAAGFGDMTATNGRKQKLQQLHRQLECILTDKLAATEQQLRGIQQGQKLLGIYRP